LNLGLSQSQVARGLGVRKETLQQWEYGAFEPTVSCVPRVIEFLAHDPRPEPTSWREWLVWYRVSRGLSQAAMARELGVAAKTLCLWETGKQKPKGESVAKLSKFRERR
jgi:DNA-binding transcriptional regulator YiaG